MSRTGKGNHGQISDKFPHPDVVAFPSCCWPFFEELDAGRAHASLGKEGRTINDVSVFQASRDVSTNRPDRAVTKQNLRVVFQADLVYTAHNTTIFGQRNASR